jgi:hypothetical protein
MNEYSLHTGVAALHSLIRSSTAPCRLPSPCSTWIGGIFNHLELLKLSKIVGNCETFMELSEVVC